MLLLIFSLGKRYLNAHCTWEYGIGKVSFTHSISGFFYAFAKIQKCLKLKVICTFSTPSLFEFHNIFLKKIQQVARLVYNIMNFWRNSNVRCILEFTLNNMRTKCMSNDDSVGISFICVMCILFSACVPRFASLLFSPFVLVHFFPVTAFNIK